MKMHAFQLCRWCDAVIPGRRKWLWLAVNLLLLILSLTLLRGLLPLILALLLGTNVLLGLYLLHRHHAFGPSYQRPPRPQDAQCETILIDAALIGQGTRLRAAAQPIDVAAELSLRLGSGALLLGAAMTLTADDLPPADRAAILSAVQTLNIKPDRMRSHNPVLRRETDEDVTIVTVRDGLQERRYYLGNPAALARRCPAIWEGSARNMTDHDHLRVADTARYIAQGNCRVLAWATALNSEEPIFLGMAGIGEALHLHALEDLSTLRSMGLTVMLDPADQSETDAASLRALLELPDHHAKADIHLTTRAVISPALCVTRQTGDSLVEPIATLRQRFRTIEDTLRHVGLLLLLALGTALLAGCSGWIIAFSAVLLTYTAVFIGVDLTAPRLRWPTLLISGALALLARFFLMGQPAPAAVMASGVIAVAAAFTAALRMGGAGLSLKGPPKTHTIALLSACAAALLLLMLLGVIRLLAASLLPLAFALIISAACFLPVFFETMLFR